VGRLVGLLTPPALSDSQQERTEKLERLNVQSEGDSQPQHSTSQLAYDDEIPLGDPARRPSHQFKALVLFFFSTWFAILSLSLSENRHLVFARSALADLFLKRFVLIFSLCIS
jgi:hypothetical protein